MNATNPATPRRGIIQANVVTPFPEAKKIGIRDLKTGRTGTHISRLDIQIKAINATCEFMGPYFWIYRQNSGMRYEKRAELLLAVQEACAMRVSYPTLMRWIDHYQKFGDIPAKTNHSKRATIKGLRATGAKFFTAEYELILKQIIDEHPQLYLDEIQHMLLVKSGKLWDTSTIWRKLHKLGYSLKTAVFRAKQQSQAELDAFHIRLLERLQHPRQLIYIDETARGANAARRRRAWSPFGVTPIIDAPMVREFDKRYTLIAACNWNGFVQEACHIVEREHGSQDDNPDRGTVDKERFEQYIEEYLVPVLGNSANAEPNSIVVMDNASIHNSDKVRKLIEDAGAMLVYTAPYSPEYNPIEYMFGEYKKSLKRHSHQEGYDWIAVHQKGLWSVTPAMAKQFFKHCEVPMIEEWLKQQEEWEKDSGILPQPFNGIYESILEMIFNLTSSS